MMKSRIVACFDEEDADGATEPTWIMGIPYTEIKEEDRRLDVYSTMWVTYRSGFPKMEPYGYTDDSGWGCMLRSAQMLMTQALQRHTLGRSWRVPRTVEERLRVPEYRTLLRLFADHPGEDSLFSIHNMCQVGIRYDKLPGEWYGPTTAACVLRDISELFAARLSPPPRPKPRGSRCPTPPLSSTSSSDQKTTGPHDSLAVQTADMSDKLRKQPSRRIVVKKPRTGKAPGPSALLGDASPGESEGVRDAGRLCGISSTERGQRESGARDCDECLGESVVFPSSRPLRVFVSQGDVVYVDEVEAVATRGGDAGTASREEESLAANGSAAPLTAAESAIKSQGDSDRGSSPTFFDPLLNPGDGGTRRREQEAWSSAIVLLIPLRLGLDALSRDYMPSLLAMLRVPQSLGFLGGRPNHAIFFIGAQGDMLIGLDPHTTQAAPEMGESFPSERYVHSLHCQSAVSMDVHRIDPSLALAFYLPDWASFQDLTNRIKEVHKFIPLKMSPSPFSVEQSRPDYEGEMGLAFMINQRDEDGTTDDDDDEYVFVKGPER